MYEAKLLIMIACDPEKSLIDFQRGKRSKKSHKY